MEPQILVQTITIVVVVASSSLATVGLLLKQMNHLETKLESRFTDKIDALDTKVTDKIDALDTKVTDKIDALDTKVTDKIDALDTKVTDKIDALDTKVDALDGKFDVMGPDLSDTRERVARIEGHLMAPEGFRPRHRRLPHPADDPPAEDPNPDHRQTG